MSAGKPTMALALLTATTVASIAAGASEPEEPSTYASGDGALSIRSGWRPPPSLCCDICQRPFKTSTGRDSHMSGYHGAARTEAK